MFELLLEGVKVNKLIKHVKHPSCYSLKQVLWKPRTGYVSSYLLYALQTWNCLWKKVLYFKHCFSCATIVPRISEPWLRLRVRGNRDINRKIENSAVQAKRNLIIVKVTWHSFGRVYSRFGQTEILFYGRSVVSWRCGPQT